MPPKQVQRRPAAVLIQHLSGRLWVRFRGTGSQLDLDWVIDLDRLQLSLYFGFYHHDGTEMAPYGSGRFFFGHSNKHGGQGDLEREISPHRRFPTIFPGDTGDYLVLINN